MSNTKHETDGEGDDSETNAGTGWDSTAEPAPNPPHDETIQIDDGAELYDLLRHRNGDETAVLLLGFGGGWQVLALDVDAGGQLLDTELVGSNQDRSKAVGMAAYWTDQNPEGVLGGADDSDGLFGNLFGGE